MKEQQIDILTVKTTYEQLNKKQQNNTQKEQNETKT